MYSKLPDGPAYPPGTGTFPSRDDVVGYLDAYAEHHRLDVRLGVKVERIERDGERWRLETSGGEMHAAHVVFAGGYEHRPFVPAWPGRARFKGTVIHAAGYRDAAPFAGQDVLVVGPGCSGAEIAYDLVEGGAARVRLAVRTPPNIIVRAPIGAPLAAAFMKLPPRVGDAVMRFVRRRTVGDLSEFGLPVPEEGVFSRLRRLHVAPMIVDAEVIEAIRERRIEIVGAVEGFDETGVLLADGDADRARRGDRRDRLPLGPGARRRPPRRARRARRAAGAARRGRARAALRRLRPAPGAAALRRARGEAGGAGDRARVEARSHRPIATVGPACGCRMTSKG